MSSTSRPPDDLIGKRLGQYEILDEIGRGGMATVYRARQPSINRIIAVKVLPRHFLHDPDFLERFKREVDVIAHLEHPHILPIYDYGEADGIPFIAMRYLAGGSMAGFVRRGLPTLESLDRPLAQMAQALDYAHLRGIIHRDLKPGNILLDENNNAYLTDFGIARVLNSSLTGSSIIGTPAYMSPEQANGLPLDGRSDIYSLGVVMFELITGREPFEAQTPMALLLKHIHEPMPLLSDFRADVPPAVEEVILRAGAKEPNDRFASASDMALAYRAALQYAPGDYAPTLPLPVRNTPTPMPQPRTRQHSEMDWATVTPAPPFQDASQRAEPQPPARPPLLAAGLVVLALAVIAVVAFALPALNPAPSQPTPAPFATPTPFPGARIAAADSFTVSIPDTWTVSDQSSEAREFIIWQQEGGVANVAIAAVKADLSDFDEAMRVYDLTYYNNPGRDQFLALIDEATAADGSLRRSYRVRGNDQFPPGQVDIFYMKRPPYLVVMETYSADSTGNTYVPMFQLILDSLFVKLAAA